MFDRLKRPRRGKSETGGRPEGDEADVAALPVAEPARPSFGRRSTPIGPEAEVDRALKAARAKKKGQASGDDFTSQPVEDTPATTWRKAAPIAPGEEVKL